MGGWWGTSTFKVHAPNFSPTHQLNITIMDIESTTEFSILKSRLVDLKQYVV